MSLELHHAELAQYLTAGLGSRKHDRKSMTSRYSASPSRSTCARS
jgi:hypothetical protein